MPEQAAHRNRFQELLDVFIRGYGAILFSDKRLPGILFLAATFYDPFVGMLGLIGNVIANALAMVVHTDSNYTRAGVFGINGTLTGLGVGLYIPHGPESIAFLILGASLATVIALSLLSSLTKRRQLPILSLPFVLTTWMILLAAQGLNIADLGAYLTPPELSAELNQLLFDLLPSWATLVLKMFGSTLFQPTLVSGLLVILGILITSRISLVFGVLGAAAGLLVYSWIGGDVDGTNTVPLGLNYILIAIALGGFFLAPTWTGTLYALFGVAIGSLVVNGLHVLLTPFDLPILVAPFNIVVLMLLYPLRSHILYAERAGLVPIPLHRITTAEEHFQWYRKRYGRRGKILYQLPFYGTWHVMQGEHGKHTHKGTQAHAYDFIVVNEQGKSFRGLGLALEDYYCFGLPVLAPAAGKIAAAVNTVKDNPPGTLNEAENWGNYVIIEHADGEFTEISHFKEQGIVVKVGDQVRQGQVLGLCGNSGYSAQPHLHIQRQKGSFIGAETMPLRFINVVVESDSKTENLELAPLPEGVRVRNREKAPSD